MNKLFLIIAFIICYSSTAQRIEVEQIKKNSYAFEKDGQKLLSFKEIVNATSTNPEAFKLAKKSKSQRTISSILSIAGAGLIGYSIGSVANGKSSLPAFAIGGGFFCTNFLFSKSSNKKILEAIDIYNKDYDEITKD